MDTAALLKSIKRRARLHLVSLPGGATTDFIEIMNEVFANEVLPQMLSFREEFYVHSETWSPRTSSTFRIPHYFIGQKVRGLYILDSTGKRIQQIAFRNRDSYDLRVTRPNNLFGIEIDDNTLIAPDNFTYDIEVAYYRMPNTMIYFDSSQNQPSTGNFVIKPSSVTPATSTTGTLQAPNTNAITFPSIPQAYDIIHPSYPYDKKGETSLTFQSLYDSNPIVATYSGDVPEVGDWLFQTGQTGFANIPRESELYFILCCSAAILNFLGAAEYPQMQELADKQLNIMKGLLDPRNDGSPWTITDTRGVYDAIG
jgi:hypothetical protein